MYQYILSLSLWSPAHCSDTQSARADLTLHLQASKGTNPTVARQVHACCSCTINLYPVSLSQCKFGEGVSTALPLAPSPPGILLYQRAWALKGVKVCCTVWSCCFSALPACSTSTSHASLAKNNSWTSFEKYDSCHTFENILQYYTPLLHLCVVNTDPHSPHFHSSGNRDCLACIPAAILIGFSLPHCKAFFPKLNWRTHQSAPTYMYALC